MSEPSFSDANRAALEWLAGRMIEDLIPDFVAGRFAGDADAEAAFEEILRTNAMARDFHAGYTAALASRSPEQWKEDARRSLAGIHARLAASSTASTKRVPAQTRVDSGSPRAGIVGRVREWFRGSGDDLSLLATQAFNLQTQTDANRRVWKLELSAIGLSEEERRERIPWAGGILQLSQARRADGRVAWSAYVEPSGDARARGVLLVALQVEGDAACEVRLKKKSPKQMFLSAALPEQLDSLRFAVAIE